MSLRLCSARMEISVMFDVLREAQNAVYQCVVWFSQDLTNSIQDMFYQSVNKQYTRRDTEYYECLTLIHPLHTKTGRLSSSVSAILVGNSIAA